MRIAILGTRGIPNHYGGFEQYAELFATYLVQQGWDVTVYNSHNHPYQEDEYKGVRIRHIKDPEKKMGTVGQFFYDLGCILDTRKEKFDIIYQLGYTSSAVFNFLFPAKTIIVTNMDGMEWKRSKYNKYVQRFLMYSEKIAVKRSQYLVADSLGIKDYLDKKYKTNAYYSAYTAAIPQIYKQMDLQAYGLIAGEYNLLVARMEPENNIDMILEAHTFEQSRMPLVIIGNTTNDYAMYLMKKYQAYKTIRFIGGVYEKSILDSIRHYSKMYFHGHSVGGTNPSLLEAMAASCNILAHDNVFNRSVLENDAWYFDNAGTLSLQLQDFSQHLQKFEQFRESNLKKIKTIFSEAIVFCGLKEKLIEWQKENVQ